MNTEDIPPDGFYWVFLSGEWVIARVRHYPGLVVVTPDIDVCGSEVTIHPFSVERFGPRLEPPSEAALAGLDERRRRDELESIERIER